MFRVEKKPQAIKLEDVAGELKRQGDPFIGRTIVVTGKLEYFTRAAIHRKIESLGAKAGRCVSKNTDYLICGEKPGNKLVKAQQLGVRVLSEQEFLTMTEGVMQ